MRNAEKDAQVMIATLSGALHIPKALVGDRLKTHIQAQRVFSKGAQEWFPLYEYDEEAGEYIVPRGIAQDIFAMGMLDEHMVYDARVEGRQLWDTWSGPPEIAMRTDIQTRAVESTLKTLMEYNHAILVAPPANGKTIMALELLRRLRVPTCVIVHKTFLQDQWEERILEGVPSKGVPAFLPGTTVGFIRQGRCDSGEDYDVVVAMVQSLAARAYDPEILRTFGFVISDEVHRLGAPMWQPTITQFPAKYRMGLTARTERNDGMHVVFEAHISRPTHVIPYGDVHATVNVRHLPEEFPEALYTNRWDGQPNYSKLISMLGEDMRYNSIIAYDIAGAAKVGRKLMVLSERKKQLQILEMLLEKRRGAGKLDKDVTIDYYIGGRKKAALAIAAKADILLCTYQFAAEALDIPELDTLVLATPKKDIAQSVGRVLREDADNMALIIVDYVITTIGLCIGLFKARKRFYTRLKLEVQEQGLKKKGEAK